MRERKDGLSNKEVTSPSYNYERSLHSTDKDFLCHDYFDFMKPTDYTYSRSPSYRRKVKSHNYQMPNLKRRQLKGVPQPMDEYSSDEEDEPGKAYYTDEEKEIVTTRTIIEDGMLLRSGQSLKSKKTMEERLKARRSLMSGKEYETLASSSRSSRASYLVNSGIKSSRGRRSLMSSSEYNSYSGALNGGNQRSLFGTNTNNMNHTTEVTTVKRTLVEEFDEDKDETMEKGMKEASSTKKMNKKKSTNTVINHMYGLDSEELSESEWSLMNPATRGSRSSQITKGYRSDSETSVTTTVVTTIIESVSYITSPLAPVWNTVGRPVTDVVWTTVSYILTVLQFVFWTCSGQYVYSLGKLISNSSWNLVQYFIMHFILLDTWTLKRRKRKSCCLCVPFLLLLPLLFAGSRSLIAVLTDSSSSSSWFSIFSSNRVIKIADNDSGSVSIGHLEDEVRRIIIQLQDRKDGLTSADVEGIVQRMLQDEISQLRLGFSEEHNQHTAAIMSQGNEFNQKLTLLNTQILNNITVLQDRLSKEMGNIQSDESIHSSSANLNIDKLKREIEDLRAALGNVELSHEMLQIQIKNCCKNDSFYAMTIQTHVDRMLQQIMSGQKTGHDDQDNFMAWFHTNYVSRQDLSDHLTKFGEQITKMVVADVEKRQKTQVYLGEGGLSEQLVQRIVEEALLKYSADKLALPDFALESAGGSVISTRCSQTYHRKTAQYSVLGIPLWYVSNSPRTVIQPEIYPGSCWAFQGTRGYLVIELSTVIKPTAFTLEHIPKSIAPDGKITSAPKDFMVLGLSGEHDTEGRNLGNFTYNEEGKPLQFFPVQSNEGVFKFIELRILGNQGNQLFTCLYRFRVHGIPVKQDAP